MYFGLQNFLTSQTEPLRRQDEQSNEPVMVDLVVTMYELNLVPGNDDDLAYQMFKGADDAAKILTATEKVFIETAVPVLPQPLDAGQILGVVLTSIGKHLKPNRMIKSHS